MPRRELIFNENKNAFRKQVIMNQLLNHPFFGIYKIKVIKDTQGSSYPVCGENEGQDRTQPAPSIKTQETLMTTY